MGQLAYYFFNVPVMQRYLPDLLHGLWVTLALAALVVAIGLTTGFALAVFRALQLRPVNWILVPVVDLVRAVPPLVIIVLVYFALPYAGIRLSSFASTVISLAAVLAAFAEEIFWAGIVSVEAGQWEAARSTGLGKPPLAWRIRYGPVFDNDVATLELRGRQARLRLERTLRRRCALERVLDQPLV